MEYIPGEFLLFYVSSLAEHTNLFPIKILCAEKDRFSFCRIRLSLWCFSAPYYVTPSPIFIWIIFSSCCPKEEFDTHIKSQNNRISILSSFKNKLQLCCRQNLLNYSWGVWFVCFYVFIQQSCSFKQKGNFDRLTEMQILEMLKENTAFWFACNSSICVSSRACCF